MPTQLSSFIGHEGEPTLRLAPGAEVPSRPAPAVSVPYLFATRAAETPKALAVCAGRRQLTFEELHLRSNQMANYLQSLGVGPEVTVCVCLKRSVDFVISALAILKAGGAYVPLDADYPAERLNFCIRDCNAHIVLTKQDIMPLLMRSNRILDLHVVQASMDSSPDQCPIPLPSPHSSAYLIYSSGSTGMPKGVTITHANLSNLVEWHRSAFKLTSKDRATQLASIGFDAAVWELWPNLCTGAAVYILEDETRNSCRLLRDFLVANSITITFVPTPLAEQLIEMEWPVPGSLRIMLTGGDTLHRYPPPTLPYTVVNNYGPTECTVVATSGIVPPSDDSSAPPRIGNAILNSHTIVVDENLNPVPAGECGELLIGGANVGRGYCNRVDLTKAKFIPDFTTSTPGARLYRSGDLVRQDCEGELVFLGRIDEQIKIRGFRIEPNEIVTELNRYPGVCQSAVITRTEGGGEKRLLAYIVADPDLNLSDSSLRQHLGRRLPAFMIPSAFIRIDKLPLTENQKVDALGLPRPDDTNTIRDGGQTSREPKSIIEERLAALVADILRVSKVQPNDNFFLLGGHSLLGAELIARIRDAFDIDLSLRKLFASPTVAELAGEVELLLLAKLELVADRGCPSSGG